MELAEEGSNIIFLEHSVYTNIFSYYQGWYLTGFHCTIGISRHSYCFARMVVIIVSEITATNNVQMYFLIAIKGIDATRAKHLLWV